MSRGVAAAVLAAGLCVATAAIAQESGSPLSVLDRMFGRNSQAAPETTGQIGRRDLSQAPATELVLRIERLEAQIRQMTGTIEQLQYRNRQLEAQIRGMGGVVGSPSGSSPQPTGPATQAVPALPGSSPQPMSPATQATPAPTSSPPAAPGRRADVFDPTLHPNAPGAPRVLGSLPAEPPPVIASEPPIGAPGGRTAGAPLDLSTLATGVPAGVAGEPALPPAAGALPAPPARNPSATGVVAAVAPPTQSPKDYYDLAYGYVLRKDYALAGDSFQDFLRKFPDDRRAPDAQFWLGESLFQRQRYDAAASAFLDLSTKHASHSKAPDALLRLAQSLAAMKQKEMACATLAEVGRKYPRASSSVKQAVEREQKRVQC
jgi:tol-pal system protein YbgF